MRELDYFTFFDTFKPILNHLDINAAENGCMFETYGEELEFVRKANPKTVWTVMTDDSGEVCISNGYHHVNRLGYLITEVEFDGQDEYLIVD